MARSLTGWTRLEPIPRSADLARALEARIADPLWLAARQWQLGEFTGEDGGSPVVAKLRAESARLSRFHPGKPPQEFAGQRAFDYDDTSMPLEALVEREAVRSPGENLKLAAEAGQHFLRLLRHHRAAKHRAAYSSAYDFPDEPPTGLDPDSSAFYSLIGGRAPDGFALRADLVAARGDAATITSLPAKPAIPAGDRAKVLRAVNDWMTWFETTITEPSKRECWNPARLEYRFAAQADLSAGPVVLHADEYSDGDLDWYSFRAASGPNLQVTDTPDPPEQITRTVIPTTVSYSGQPADRYWAFEDGKVSFGALNAAPGDLARVIMVEFALVYGNDWFVMPVDLPVGSVCAIESLEITDTFGEITVVEKAADNRGSKWAAFDLSSSVRPAYLKNLFFLPPTLPKGLQGDVVEEVALFRDEMANMVWGVERKVQSPTGHVVDRYEERQQALGRGEAQRLDGDIADAELVYRLQTEVPEHWIPFVPVPAPGSGGNPQNFAIRLERRAMLRVRPDGTETIEPKGRILMPGRRFRLEEEEVPRRGVVVERHYQHARWTDGRGHLWMARRTRPGRGEGHSGLRYDLADRPRR